MDFRIEFNEKQQGFHLDHYTQEPDTFGWVTIAEHIEDRMASEFCRLVENIFLTKKMAASDVKQLWRFYTEILKSKFVNSTFVK